MATCMRSAYELFSITSPGPSDHLDLSAANGSFWKDEPVDAKYLCLDSSPEQQRQQQQQQQPMAVCAGCRLEIADRYFMRVNPNLEFHTHCLKCVQCSRPLDENQTTFVRNGLTYCRDDYRSLFTTRCSGCQGEFDKTDLVMKAGPHNVFHLRCFSCTACEKRLQTGEEFQIKNNSLYCRGDCRGLPEDSRPDSALLDFSKLSNNNNDNNNSSSNFDEDEWDEERSTLTSLDNNTSSPLGSPKSDGVQTPLFGNHHHHSGSGGSSSSCGKKKKDKQATRVRTVLNEQQLKILKDCYSCNSRPDASLKEKLVEMTGLNARVIRVWFQNKRCKDKKRQIQISDARLHSEREEVLNRVRVNGIGPLMVQPATPHIDTSMGGPIDIQHFAQWTSTPPSSSQYGNPMMFNSPVEMPPYGVTPILPPVPMTSSDGPVGASVFPHYSPQQQHSTLTASSHPISSPTSCSE
ncbi:CRE-LIM-7 protein [Caenorhabditis remanei]|uniref:CRE-LIM-7 protein n=2 Tax=Caenorhabditis remanei TaxID=31234 RepID=E3NFD1_CAERE|nr:CRE-LIM-7 protein [Caenorhabditis remanei]